MGLSIQALVFACSFGMALPPAAAGSADAGGAREVGSAAALAASSAAAAAAARPPETGWALLATPQGALLSGGIFMSGCVALPLLTNNKLLLTDCFAPFAPSGALGAGALASYIGAMSLSNTAGRVCVGPASDAIGRRAAYALLGLQVRVSCRRCCGGETGRPDARGARGRVRPVSYTHLTLPTILLV